MRRWLWLALVACLGVTAASAQTPPAVTATDGITVTPIVSGGAVSVSFAAGAAIGTDVRSLVESGLLVTVTFAIDLRKPASVWWDRTVRSQVVASTIKLDTLSGMYHVSRLHDGHVTWSDRTRDFTEARDWAGTFERIALATPADLDSNGDYYIDVRMSASPRRTFTLWPFGSDVRSGRAEFTFIR